MTSGQSSDHEQTSTNTSIATAETKFLGDLNQSRSGALTGKTFGLVDFGKHGVGGLGDQGSGETGDQARSQVDDGLGSIRSSVLVDGAVDLLGNLFIDDELGHGVRDLLEENGAEAAVESTDSFLAGDLAEPRDKAGREGWFGDKTNTGRFEGAEGNVGKELGGGGGGEVDGGSVVRGGLIAKEVDGLLLEEFVTSKLEGALEEITGKGRANTSQESTCALVGNDFSEASDQASVVCDRVELDSGFDTTMESVSSLGLRRSRSDRVDVHIDRGQTTVGDGTADGASKGLGSD